MTTPTEDAAFTLDDFLKDPLRATQALEKAMQDKANADARIAFIDDVAKRLYVHRSHLPDDAYIYAAALWKAREKWLNGQKP